MSPIIPSPTPIIGIRNPDGTPRIGKRLELAELQKKEFAFALYTQALLKWQQDGNEIKDPDNVNGTSYFQVTGIHGVPYVPWQQDDDIKKPVVRDRGYCTHRSVLFVPWHRPYLLLYEQIIYQYALEIVEKSDGYAKQAYEEVLDFVRLPYWDFNKDSSLPEAVKQPTIQITIPGAAKGEKNVVELDHNPFYSYKFTSDYAWVTVTQELDWAKKRQILIENWTRDSKRCPDQDGVSRPEIADKQMKTVGSDYKQRAYSLTTSVHDFAEFTTQAYRGPNSNDDSVEVWHNYVHNYCGTEDADFQHFKPFPEKHPLDDDYAPDGNLTDVQGSSFDPLFWLLHCHIDRISAIWQAMNYANTTIVERPSYTDRANATSGTKEDGSSHLEPWHYSVRHNKQDYWTADDTKDLSSTFDYGYYYPETPVKYRQRKDEGLMRKHAIEQVNKLYAPPNVLEKMYLPPGEKGDPIRDLEWRAFVHIKSFAVSGTWGIHLFFGDPPDSSSDWFLADNRVGTVNVLSNSNIGACPNCKKQQEDGQLITGIVLLSNELQIKDRNVPVMDRAAVVEYLKKNLTWRIAKDAREVPIKDDMGLVVGVAAREVVYPLEPTKLPLWNKAEYFPDATRGKPGGFDGILVEVTS